MAEPSVADKPEVITLPADDRLVYPGAYLGCLSARYVRSWSRGDGYERCYMPRGHDGDHDNLSDRGRIAWPSGKDRSTTPEEGQ